MKQNRANVQPEIVDGATPLLWTASPKGTLSHTPERSESERLESITCCKILDKILYIRFIQILQVHSSLQPGRLKSQTSPLLHNQWQELLGRRAEEDLPSSKIIHEPQMDKKSFYKCEKKWQKSVAPRSSSLPKEEHWHYPLSPFTTPGLLYHLETKWGIECENHPNHTIIIDFLWPTIILLDPTHFERSAQRPAFLATPRQFWLELLPLYQGGKSWRPQNGLTGFVWHLETFRAGIGSKKFVASAFLCMSCDDSESNLKLQALSFGQFCEGIKSCACHCLFLSLRKARDPWDGGLLSCCSALSTVERQSQSLFQSWVLSIPPTLQATIVLRKRLCFE